MARGKRILVRRQNRSPAVRLNFAGSFATAGALERAEQENPHHGAGSARPDCGEAMFSTVEQQDQAERVPEPSVASACRNDHENAEPSWRTPAVHAAHQPMVV